ncbi:AAA family ATPase [Sphingomonas sp. RT2P30]|uniref:bifunctional aminoglycoside phosphotransferase/ATP-binding protein n=1 Tax=Parasphingomonas halimpatiens TaxID=3096162 RepID=UPI002FC6D452
MKPATAARPSDTIATDVVAFLEHRAFGADAFVRRIDTHAASIFLTGERAWKLKRPVRLGYLDFSTLARRRAALAAELRLNRRTAPDLYRALHAITREADGSLAIDGQGEAIDWLLEMQRFADDALLDDCARRGALDPALLASLAARIQLFHAAAEPVNDGNGAGRLAAVIDGNGVALAGFPALFMPEAVAALLRQQRERLGACRDRLDRRAARGRVRHCHGDLHLANIALIDGAPTPFDCLEFDDALATTDILYDLAFLLMDLWHRGLHGAANLLFNRYLDLSGDDEDGLVAMPLMLSVRATIRAHVSASRARHSGLDADAMLARDYFALAQRMLVAVPPRLVAVGGRSGTGKSMLARAIAGAIGVAPGARVLRSDVVRKRLAGVSPETALARGRYTAQSAEEVYTALEGQARLLLSEGTSVIADAAFLLPEQRAAIARVAAVAAVPFAGLWLAASEAVRVWRVTGRSGDASDADATIVRRQSRQPVGPMLAWHRLSAGRDAATVVRSARRALRSALRVPA